MSVKVTNKLGFQQQLVQVIELVPTQNMARCQIPKTTQQFQVGITQRSNTAWPQVGDFWIITRTVGPWDFSIKLTDVVPPSVTGNVATGSALDNFINAMKTIGLVSDQTTEYSDAWQTPSYAAHWADATSFNGLGGGHGLRYCLVDGGKTLWLYGLVAASTGAGTTVTTLASGYYPTVTTGYGSYIKVNAGTFTNQPLAVSTAGALIVGGVPANGDVFLLNSRIPLGTLP